MKKSFFRSGAAFAAVVALILSVLACEKRENKRLTDFTSPNYSRIDSIVQNTIKSVDRHIFYGPNYDKQRADFLVDSLKQIIDRMEADGVLNGAAIDVWRGYLYQYAIMDDDAEECYRHAMTYDSPADRQLWYYNFAGSELAYLLYMRHNYDGFLRVAVPLLASMDSLGNGLYNQKIDLYSLMGCCYLKLEQPDKAKEIVIKARDYGREVLLPMEPQMNYNYEEETITMDVRRHHRLRPGISDHDLVFHRYRQPRGDSRCAQAGGEGLRGAYVSRRRSTEQSPGYGDAALLQRHAQRGLRQHQQLPEHHVSRHDGAGGEDCRASVRPGQSLRHG